MSFVVAKSGKPSIYVHSADLGDNGRVSNPTLNAQTQQSTTFADSGVKRKVGNKDISYAFEGLFDGAAKKSHAALNDLRANQRIVSMYPEGDVVGNPGIVLNEAHAEQYAVAPSVGELAPVTAQIMQSGVEELVKSLYAKPSAAITADTNGTAVDNGASSADGGSFVIHVFTFSAEGGNARWIARIQHSDDDGAVDPYADIETLTITAVGGQRVAFTGTVKRYLRVRWDLDATTGSLVAQAGAHRN